MALSARDLIRDLSVKRATHSGRRCGDLERTESLAEHNEDEQRKNCVSTHDPAVIPP